MQWKSEYAEDTPLYVSVNNVLQISNFTKYIDTHRYFNVKFGQMCEKLVKAQIKQRPVSVNRFKRQTCVTYDVLLTYTVFLW